MYLIIVFQISYILHTSIHRNENNINVLCVYLSQRKTTEESGDMEWEKSEVYYFKIIPMGPLKLDLILPKYLVLHYNQSLIKTESHFSSMPFVLNTLLSGEYFQNSTYMLAALNGSLKNSVTAVLSGDSSNKIAVRIQMENLYPELSLITENVVQQETSLNSVNSVVEIGRWLTVLFNKPLPEGLSSFWSGCELVKNIKRGSLDEHVISFLDHSLDVKFYEQEEESAEPPVSSGSVIEKPSQENRKKRGVFLVVALMVLTVFSVAIYIYFFLNSASRKIYKRKVSKNRSATGREHRVSLPKITGVKNK